MFALLVIANINMALQGTDVKGLEFGRTYLVIRPFLQPVFMLWALYAGGVIGRRVTGGGAARFDHPPKPDGISTGRRGLL